MGTESPARPSPQDEEQKKRLQTPTETKELSSQPPSSLFYIFVLQSPAATSTAFSDWELAPSRVGGLFFTYCFYSFTTLTLEVGTVLIRSGIEKAHFSGTGLYRRAPGTGENQGNKRMGTFQDIDSWALP